METSCLPRRDFLRGLSAIPVAARAGGLGEEEAGVPALRELAGGRPLIGVAVPTHAEREFGKGEKELLAAHFDSVTPENCMKWQNLCPGPGDYHLEPVDELFGVAEANRQKVVGHTLLFNREHDFPGWILRDGDGEADEGLLWRRIEEHVVKLMTRYKGRVDSWDVLNEFVEPDQPGYRETGLTRILGGGFPARLFRLAAEIDPGAKLVYNDFGIEEPRRRAAVIDFVRSLQDQGCRVDVVGSQSHLEVDGDYREEIEATIREFSALGVRTAFTELDVDVIPRRLYWNPETRAEAVRQDPYRDGASPEVLERQAEVYRGVFEAVMANRKDVDRVTFWGISDGGSWLNDWPWRRVNHPLLFDRELALKPAFYAVAEVLRAAG